MATYKIIDLRTNVIDREVRLVEGAASPEDAVRRALGIHVVRSGARRNLAARVYWERPLGSNNMIRLYLRVEEDRINRSSKA